MNNNLRRCFGLVPICTGSVEFANAWSVCVWLSGRTRSFGVLSRFHTFCMWCCWSGRKPQTSFPAWLRFRTVSVRHISQVSLKQKKLNTLTYLLLTLVMLRLRFLPSSIKLLSRILSFSMCLLTLLIASTKPINDSSLEGKPSETKSAQLRW